LWFCGFGCARVTGCQALGWRLLAAPTRLTSIDQDATPENEFAALVQSLEKPSVEHVKTGSNCKCKGKCKLASLSSSRRQRCRLKLPHPAQRKKAIIAPPTSSISTAWHFASRSGHRQTCFGAMKSDWDTSMSYRSHGLACSPASDSFK
jgi:hypothetical protein